MNSRQKSGRGKKEPPIQEGGIYLYFDSEEEAHCLVKVLKHEKDIVHLRFYDFESKKRPKEIDFQKIDWVIGHLPYSEEAFYLLKPELIKVFPVTPEELEGYEEWKADQGGVFGS